MAEGGIRLFVETRLAPDLAFPASAAQAHYLDKVMRRETGDPVILFNGTDGEWAGEIASVRRAEVVLRAVRPLRPQSNLRPLTLIFAPLKRDATDLIIQKATELGVTEFQPVVTARSNIPKVNLDRWRAIAIEAAEQCERLELPALHPLATLGQVLGAWPAERKLAACFERSDSAPITARAEGLIVGPEGGFTGAELDVMRRCTFLTPVSLGPLILRAETAAIAGLALLQAH